MGNGSDANIFYSRTIDGIITAGVEVVSETLSSPKVSTMSATTKIGEQTELVYHKAVSVDTELQIRQVLVSYFVTYTV